MSRFQYSNNMPPGLMTQIVIALMITIGALLVLPGTLSAGPTGDTLERATVGPNSAGAVVTTLRHFSASELQATAFSDWDDRG